MIDIEKELTEHLSKMNTAPFLFIGSGFSRRYINLENWEGLLRKFSDLVPQDFDYYSSTSRKDWAKAADMMANDFHSIWWKDDKYKDSREEFKGRIASNHSPLKVEISKYLRDIKYIPGIDVNNDIEINELKKVVIDGIITTNWDKLLEDIFAEHEMEVYVGQKELLFSQQLEVNEMYKIHGCSSIPDSLVLTDEDYKDFNEKNAYLAAKLLTIFIEHPVIFIGYSLSDSNIHQILKSITACLDETNADKLKDRLIFIERCSDQLDTFESSSMTINQLTIPITRVKTNRYDLVYRAISKNKRKYSMKVMRNIKSQIYELIKTNDPSENIHVIDYDKINDLEDVEFVIGVGVKAVADHIKSNSESSASLDPSQEGYASIEHHELFKEILSDEPQYNYNLIVEKTLPELLKVYKTIPVNKYVVFSNVDEDKLDPKIKTKRNFSYKDFLTRKHLDKLEDFAVQWQFNSIRDLIEGYSEFGKAIEYIPLLGEEKLDVNELKAFLNENIHYLKDKGPVGTNIRKLFRIYDFLVYGIKK